MNSSPEALREAKSAINEFRHAAFQYYTSFRKQDDYNAFQGACEKALGSQHIRQLRKHKNTFDHLVQFIKSFFVTLKRTLFGEDTTKLKFF